MLLCSLTYDIALYYKKCHNPWFIGFSFNKHTVLRGWTVFVICCFTTWKVLEGASSVMRRSPCSTQGSATPPPTRPLARGSPDAGHGNPLQREMHYKGRLLSVRVNPITTNYNWLVGCWSRVEPRGLAAYYYSITIMIIIITMIGYMIIIIIIISNHYYYYYYYYHYYYWRGRSAGRQAATGDGEGMGAFVLIWFMLITNTQHLL